MSIALGLSISACSPSPSGLVEERDTSLRQLDLDRLEHIIGGMDFSQAARFVVANYGADFTVTTTSMGTQGDERAIFFGQNGDLILTLGHDSVEIHGVETKREDGLVSELIPFAFIPNSDEVGFDLIRFPSDEDMPDRQGCQGCHDPHNRTFEDGSYDFAFLWDPYDKWAEMLGGDDDRIDNFLQYDDIRKRFARTPGFEELFRKDEVSAKGGYPYHNSDVEVVRDRVRKLANMPNDRLTKLLANMQASYLWSQLRGLEDFEEILISIAADLYGCSEFVQFNVVDGLREGVAIPGLDDSRLDAIELFYRRYYDTLGLEFPSGFSWRTDRVEAKHTRIARLLLRSGVDASFDLLRRRDQIHESLGESLITQGYNSGKTQHATVWLSPFVRREIASYERFAEAAAFIRTMEEEMVADLTADDEFFQGLSEEFIEATGGLIALPLVRDSQGEKRSAIRYPRPEYLDLCVSLVSANPKELANVAD